MNDEKKEFSFDKEIKTISIKGKTFSTDFNVSEEDLKSEVFDVSFNRVRRKLEVYAGSKLLTSDTKGNNKYLIITAMLFVISLLFFLLSRLI